MITVGGIELKDIDELRATWARDGDMYTSPDGSIRIWIVGDYCTLGNCCTLGDYCKLGYGCTPPYQPLWFCGPQYSIGYHSPGMVSSGCITKPIHWWEENIRRCAEEYNYTPADIDEYEWRVKVLADWMKRHGVYAVEKETHDTQ